MAYTTVQTRTNLVTNPSFETDITGWSTSGTVARTTAESYVGGASVALTYAGSGTTLISTSPRISASAGQTFTLSFYLKQSIDAGTVICNFLWYNAGGTIILDDSHQANNPNTTWQRFSQTRTAPASTASFAIRVYQVAGEGGGAVATVNYVDAVLVEQTSTLRPYFDGLTADAYSGYILDSRGWTGTANASTSTTTWWLQNSFVDDGVIRFNTPFSPTAGFRRQTETPNYAPRKVIYFVSPFKTTQGFYGGVTTRTATGSGTGTQTGVRTIVKVRTATGSGTGTQSASRVAVCVRTATGSGTGTETASRLIIRFRTATGSGTGTQTASRVIIKPRTATGSGQGTETASGFITLAKSATGSGQGTQSASGLHVATRTATGEGLGSASTTTVLTAIRTAIGSGTGTESATGVRGALREATGSGQGTTADTAIGLRIVLRTASGNGTGSASAERVLTAIRTATGSGTGTQVCVGARRVDRSASASATGSSSATQNKLLIFYTPSTTQIRAADRFDDSIAGLLFRYAEPTYAGVNVYKLTDGTFTQVEQRDYDLISKVYWGGSKNFVSAEEKQELVAAGYGSYVT